LRETFSTHTDRVLGVLTTVFRQQEGREHAPGRNARELVELQKSAEGERVN
jgi:hypothetical protein